MSAETAIKRALTEAGLPLFAPLPLAECRVTKKYLLDRSGIGSGTVFICAVPYLSPKTAGEHNISAYAAVRDYHVFFEQLWRGVTERLSRELPQYRFVGFADHSPIDERDAALKAGLGVLGENGMLITEAYSSYVFLGELITDATVPCNAVPIRHCDGCGLCKAACPREAAGECLSAVTQKKGELTEREAEAMAKHGTAWGCDVCQRVCPHTHRAIERRTAYTDIDYFLTDIITELDTAVLNAMDDGEFATRAYSWRGRETVLRNLGILESAVLNKSE